MTELADLDLEPVTQPNGAGEPDGAPPPLDEWKTDSRGRMYTPRREGKGIVYRQGEETIAQALERDATGPRDQRPRPKSKRPKMPEAPRKVDLKELERTLAEALKAPAMMCATFGDEWAANHFTMSGPYLARNLVMASEHNPWLRRKLEEAATGQDAMMLVVSMVGVGGALFTYLIPPIIHWFNLPVPEKAREMFGIPPRREQEPPYAASTPSAAQPEHQVPFAA
jgi:hypothetical protein